MSRLRYYLPLMLMAAIGCDDGRVKLPSAPVAGTVTYQGKPLAGGRVLFCHPSGQPAGAAIAADGSFKLRAFQGKNQVAVQWYVKPDSSFDTDIGLGPFKSLVPDRYADVNTSGLTFEVKAGENDNAAFILKD
jgi:hypothetical protein